MPIVTISRGTLIGGEELANLLSQRLHYPAVGLEVIREAASLYGISEATISQELHEGPGVVERLSREKRRLHLIAIQSALVDRALRGDFIYHGLAGHFLLQGVPTVLKVRLVAPLAYRLEKVRQRKTLTEEEAIRYLKKIDQNRSEWARFLYDVDWTDPNLYDMVINLEHLTLDTACGMIMYVLSRPEFRDTPEKNKAIQNLALVARVKTKLALDERTRGLEVDVEAAEGTVTITGSLFAVTIPFTTGTRRTADDITAVAKSVPGVKEVALELRK